MKIKPFFFALILAAVLCSCTKQLDVSVEYNTRNPNDAPVLYWVNNNTGADIPKVTYKLNGEYLYTDDLPAGGCSIILSEFAKKNGERFNILNTKPLKLEIKANGAAYSVNIDDIPVNFGLIVPNDETISQNRDVLSWYDEISAAAATSDGSNISISVALGYKADDKATSTELVKRKAEICSYLQDLIKNKTFADFSPKNENALGLEIRDYINDNVITGRVREVLFTDINF